MRAWLIMVFLALTGCITTHIDFASTPTISDKAVQETGQAQGQDQGQMQRQDQRQKQQLPQLVPRGTTCPKP